MKGFRNPPPVAILRLLTALCLSVVWLAVLPQAGLAEHVKELRQNLTLGSTGRLSVDETVIVDFGNAKAPYFCRRIATLYKRSGKLCSLDVYVKSVSNGQGQKQEYSTKDMHGYENIVVPSGPTPLMGTHTYHMSYDLIHSVNFVSGHPELFYSALGREWSGPIDKVSLAFSLSPAQNGHAAQAVGYVGAFGAKRHARSVSNGGALHFAAEKFAPGQDLVVVLPLPPGAVSQGGLADSLSELYQTSSMAVLLPVGTLIVLILLWLLIGSDQHFGKKPEFALGAPWQPPRDITPAELGTIRDENCEDKDLMITVFDLACRGYLAIRETPNHGLHGYGNKDYEFSQPPQPVTGILKPHEEVFLNTLFMGRNKVYLSDMQGFLRDYLPQLRKLVMETLTKDKYFARNPQADRDYFTTCGACVLGFGAAFYAYSVFMDDSFKIISYGIIVSGILIILSSGVMPKRTRKGVAAIQQSHTFEHFILHASDQDIEKALSADPTVFFRLLPYSIVLGMGEIWADRFKHLVKQSPPWYISMEEATGEAREFSTAVLVREMLAAESAIMHTAVAKPDPQGNHSSKSSAGSSRYLP